MLDFDRACELLGLVAQSFEPGSEESRAIEFAAIALHFVRDLGKLGELSEYVRRFNADLDRDPDRVFQRMDEAIQWLSSADPGHIGMLVEVSGARFLVVPGKDTALQLLPVILQRGTDAR